MKNKAQIMPFKLSVLATFMLCTTANNYASDIEIYKAPMRSDGNAKIMFVLDVSTYMYQSTTDSGGSGGGNSGISSASPIPADFGFSCPSNKALTEVRYAGTTYSYDASYCETTTATDKVKAGCDTAATQLAGATPVIPTGTYRCYDRLSRLKRALFEVIDDSRYAAEAAATDTTGQRPRISLGFSFYPLVSTFGDPLQPILLDAAGRTRLKERLAKKELPVPDTSEGAKTAQVAQAYGRGVNSLIAAANATSSTTEQQCSGYGVYMVSGRNPDSDIGTNQLDSKGYDGALLSLNKTLNTETKNSNPLASVCSWGNSSSSNGTSWKCVEKAAGLLMASKSLLNIPIRTAVVSMGGGLTDAKELGTSFAFYGVDARTDFSKYETRTVTNATGESIKVSTTVADVEADYNRIKVSYASPLLEDRRYAIRTGVAGDGGYFAVSNVAALRQSIDDFILKTLKVDIPYLTTGAPTIPQDPLNPALVQNDAYYSQFKPTPKIVAEDANRLWVGNMKKYHVTSLGRLVGKGDSAVLDDIGRLVEGVKDFWAPPVSTNETIKNADEDTWGSELYARMGGAKSQLPLTSIVSGATVVDRKVLTNRLVANDGSVSERTTLNRIDTNYAANDPKRSDIMKLLELRQVGAVMHSSPLLLSNEGKITYNATTKKLESSGREDYVLFGSTQGILHVVKAPDYNEVMATDGSVSNNGGGKEVFAFVPHEMIEKQSKAFLKPEATTGGTANLFYGIDAPWTTYTEYVPKSDGTLTVGTGKTTDTTTLKGKQWVYGGLRMGGRSYYALDLGNMNDPKLKFHINPADQKVYYNNSSTTFAPLQYMGQSWSKPKMAWVNWQGSRKLVMFVGGGYDATGGLDGKGYENDSYSQTNKKGAGIYMFDALNGDLLWWASDNASATSDATSESGVIALKDSNLQYSVVSDIKTADRDNDGLVDHLYFGDLGGQVFRIDLNNKAATIGAFATRSIRILNMHASGGASPRFYAAPSFAIFEDSATSKLFAAISIGSGNLSHPLAQYASGREHDALYTIYDKDVTRPDLYTTTTFKTQDTSVGNTTALSALNEITTENRFSNTSIVAPYASSAGWYFKFKGENKIAQQEKVFYSPTVIDYDLYISSYDSSRLGLTGVCGGGVQGISKVRLFCMPFGQCPAGRFSSSTEAAASDEHGLGIQNHAIANPGDGTTRLVGGAILGNNLNDQYGTKIKLIPQRWYER